jgi:hypothetical protein
MNRWAMTGSGDLEADPPGMNPLTFIHHRTVYNMH